MALGSIGRRHFKNLKELGIKQICFYRVRNDPIEICSRGVHVEFYTDLEEAIRSVDFAVITNPTHLHLEVADQCVKKNLPVYIEKPLGNSLVKALEFRDKIRTSGVACCVGYMMRFHPHIETMRNIIESRDLGKVVRYEGRWGEFLPDWHPYEDYRKSYASNSDMGGGVVLTLSHEIDLLKYFLSEPVQLRSEIKSSRLIETNCEDIAKIEIDHANGEKSEILLDYETKPPIRYNRVELEKGVLHFNFYSNTLKIETENQKKKEFINLDRNELFVKSMKYFLEVAFNGKRNSLMSVENAVEVLEICEDVLERGRRRDDI